MTRASHKEKIATQSEAASESLGFKSNSEFLKTAFSKERGRSLV